MPDARTLPEPVRPPLRAMLQIGRATHVVWSPYTLAIPDLPPRLAGLRIVQFTDLHMTPRWMPAFDAVLKRLDDDPPDLMLVTGDFVDAKDDPRPALPNVRRLLDRLHARLGVYGILGNHDGDALAAYTRDWPVRLLYNETVTLRDGDTAIDLIGLHGVHPDDAPPAVIDAIEPRLPNTLRLVMAHFPQQVDRLPPGQADVVFAGHTHGGQVCLPGGWPPVTHDPLPRRFARGVHWMNDRWLVVPRGLGFSLLPVRLFCPPEVIEVTLRVPSPSVPSPGTAGRGLG